MSNKMKGIWIGERDLNQDPSLIEESQQEGLVELISKENDALSAVGGNRRDFLRMMGFGLGAAAVAAGCDIPVKRAIPYVVKPDEIVPGVANYYASSYVEGGDFCSILVKTREGRPIKIEGNSLSSVTGGGTSARAQSSVLSLYDVNRLKAPSMDGEASDWGSLDAKVTDILNSARGIRLISNTILSPTSRQVIQEFIEKYPSTKWISYDPVSSAAILKANEEDFGARAIPAYHFDQAEIIVSFNADFLGTWISPTEYARQYARGRKIKDIHAAKMSKHVQVESHMSMTGSNADNRILVKPSEQGSAIAYLYEMLSAGSSTRALNEKAKQALAALADQLKTNPSKSLVVSSSNDVAEQKLINAINHLLDNYGHTLDFNTYSLQRQGDETGLAELLTDINSGLVDAVIFLKSNPVYEYSSIEGLKEALETVKNRINLGYEPNETNGICNISAPVHHNLESWGDAEPKRGSLSLIQPVISPLFNTRQAEESLLRWTRTEGLDLDPEMPYYSYLKKHWEDNFLALQSEFLSFQAFWDKCLHDGVFEYKVDNSASYLGNGDQALAKISDKTGSELEICFSEPVSISNGVHANNPWLQEMPDPVSRCTWGNYLAVPVDFDGVRKFVGLNDLKDGDLVELIINDKKYTVPVIQQFGQMKGTVSIHLGYGRTVVGEAGQQIGVDFNQSVQNTGGLAQYYATNVSLGQAQGKEKHFSSVQYHHTMGVKAQDKKTGEIINADEAATVYATYGFVTQGFQGSLTERSIIRHTHVDDLEQAVENLRHEREHHEGLNQHTLYPFEKYTDEFYSQGHHWGMHVDLNACIGCGACTVACMAENNVPVVGKKQVSRHQEMAWLRIDRYYYGDVSNPNVVYQPMMCQHCDNAPCENVCPVNATSHSAEGLNQMTYNRCIGTRYCANNCPYKVRRFNWLDYSTADLFPANQVDINHEEIPYGADNLTRMVLNPDVTVRSRGVIEKCSFCVQRIQEGKLTAKKEMRKLNDSDVRTACQTACPTGAITFGDQNNEGGNLTEQFESPLNMVVLEEINVRSSVRYTMKVHNRDKALEA